MITQTLTIIKPDAVKAGVFGEILQRISNEGFLIKALKMTQLDSKEAQQFYSIHQGKPFFEDLVQFMTSGPIIVAVLEKENAVENFRQLIGNTNPSLADEGTIRKKYATSIRKNAIHGSDSVENAQIEIAFHFSKREIY